jgi:iron complex outermembrane recepter protein
MRIALAVAVALGIGSIVIADPTHATIKKTTNIAAQALGPALKEFAASRELQILYFTDTVRHLQTPGAVGEITTDEALTKILTGTGLTYRYLNDNTITIVPAGQSNSNSPSPTRKEKSFWDRFRLAQTPDANASNNDSVTRQNEAGELKQLMLEEVVVTAQKRPERLIDTPQSVSVLSSETLSKLGATQFRDFATTVAGLTYTTSGAGSTQISLRGTTVGLDVGPTVGIYVDDVPYGSSSSFAAASGLALDVGLFDIDRIEVLRGPQGTLYGASTMGGLLKYVNNRPDMDTFDLRTRLGVSGTQDGGINYDGAIAVNAPLLADKAALRASAFYSRDDGYVDNLTLNDEDINRADIYGARADLLLTPTDRLSIRLGAFLQNISRDGNAVADFSPAGAPLDGELDQRRSLNESFDQRFRLVSATITYDFGPSTLTSISSYQTVRAPWIVDFTSFFGLPGFSVVGYSNDISTDKFTQEVRLASNGSAQIEWLIGAFYTHETSGNEQAFILRDLAGAPLPNTFLTYSAPSQYEETAAFGDLTWRFTDKFDVTGGVRFAHNRQSFTQNATGVFSGALNTPTGRSDEDVFTYLGSARYHFTDRSIGYARYATGYRPGGPNFALTNPATGQPYGPESFEADRLKSYELGYKIETVDRRYGADMAIYYIDWNNIQLVSIVGGFGFKTNAPGGAEVQGAELSLTARPIDSLTLTGAFAYQDAKLSEADTILSARKDERLPNVPHFTGALGADFELASSGLKPTIGATVRHVSDRRVSFDGSTSFPQYSLPAYTTADIRFGLTLSSTDIQLYAHNLFDERGQLSAVTNFGPPQVTILQPRTIGISASTRF